MEQAGRVCQRNVNSSALKLEAAACADNSPSPLCVALHRCRHSCLRRWRQQCLVARHAALRPNGGWTLRPDGGSLLAAVSTLCTFVPVYGTYVEERCFMAFAQRGVEAELHFVVLSSLLLCRNARILVPRHWTIS